METTKRSQPEQRMCQTCQISPVVPYPIGPAWIYPRSCPTCRDTMWQDWDRRQAEENCKFKKAMIQWRIAEAIPKYFWSAAIETLPGQLEKKIEGLPADKGLFLFGPVGCGKSYTLAAIARQRIESGVWPVALHNWERFLSGLRASYGIKAGETDRLIMQTMNAAVLLIDDLSIGGVESEFSLKTLYSILDYRIEHGLPTFFSANRTPDEIGKAYDQRIASRIKGHCQILHYDGKDRRVA
jgi:DNA replication protein DnaC